MGGCRGVGECFIFRALRHGSRPNAFWIHMKFAVFLEAAI